MKTYSLSQLTLCYLLMKVDGNIAEEEKRVIYKIFENHKLSQGYIDAVIKILDKSNDENSFTIAIDKMSRCSYEEKMELVNGLVEIAQSDGMYADDEVQFILKVKKHLGVL